MIYGSSDVDCFCFTELFIRSLLRAEVQLILNLSAETIQWSSALAQGEEGNWWVYAMCA